MDVMMHRQAPHQSSSSSLNPNAPVFVPMKSYQTVEDFSDQWWDLVHSSPFFRDYWLQDCFQEDDPQSDLLFPQNDDLILPDFDAFFDLYLNNQEEKKEEEKKREKELISIAALKWSKSSGRAVEASRCLEKVPKIVKSVKVSPRAIHQPR